MNKTWNVRGQLVDLSTPLVMGVINLTPDSFYSGSRSTSDDVLHKADQMIADGADIIDIGGYSSRPNAEDIPEADELARAIPAISKIVKEFPKVLISIDTFRTEVARQAIDCGASLVNDISAGELNNNKLPEMCASLKLPLIAMHMKGTPQTMNNFATYDNLLEEVVDYFQKKLTAFLQMGLSDVVVDPGFGFAKTVEHNFMLLKRLSTLKILGKPILAGLSRKSLIWRTLNISPEESLTGTTALNMAALMNGASILRVHDVREARQCVALWKKIENA